MIDPEERRARNRERCRKYRAAHLEEAKAANRAYREAHRKELSAYLREYRKDNRERLIAFDRARYTGERRQAQLAHSDAERKAHPEKTRAYLHAYYQANRQKAAAYGHAWYEAHRAEAIAQARAWRKADPKRWKKLARVANARRRTLVRGAAGDATPAQIEARWAMWGDHCWMCGASATTTDHVKPLNKGGSNWPANLRPACDSCNKRKQAKWPWTVDALMRSGLE